MGAKEGEGIGMMSGKERVNLRTEARIAGSNRCRAFHGGALFRQVEGLRDLTNAARPGKPES